jgi:hypothetical protein
MRRYADPLAAQRAVRAIPLEGWPTVFTQGDKTVSVA